MISHRDHKHPSTPAARKACREALAAAADGKATKKAPAKKAAPAKRPAPAKTTTAAKTTAKKTTVKKAEASQV